MMLRRADGVVLQKVDDRAFLLDAAGAEMIVLNAVGTMVWEALDEPSDPDTIGGLLVDRFDDVSEPQLVSDVSEFLDELAELGLVVPVT
jgi:coenzyme PQQ synthesis protein D (PqqD)